MTLRCRKRRAVAIEGGEFIGKRLLLRAIAPTVAELSTSRGVRHTERIHVLQRQRGDQWQWLLNLHVTSANRLRATSTKRLLIPATNSHIARISTSINSDFYACAPGHWGDSDNPSDQQAPVREDVPGRFCPPGQTNLKTVRPFHAGDARIHGVPCPLPCHPLALIVIPPHSHLHHRYVGYYCPEATMVVKPQQDGIQQAST